jgi:hypothetical protein
LFLAGVSLQCAAAKASRWAFVLQPKGNIMSEALAINTRWTVRDFHSHLELRGDVGQYIQFADVGELLECMDWLEKHFGHVRDQRPTQDAQDVSFRRCPVCSSLLEERSVYCYNCGTDTPRL